MRRNLFQLYFQVPDGTGAGGPAGGSALPASTTPSATPGSGTPAATGTPGVGAAPAGGSGAASGAGAPPDPNAPDRSTWIPPYRLKEENDRYTALEHMPDEAFGWLLLYLAGDQGRQVWPDGLGGFLPASRKAIERVQVEAKKLARQQA